MGKDTTKQDTGAPTNELVVLENVDICQKEQVVLKDVYFTLHKSEFVFLIGSTGSGKSSLLKSLYCDLPIEKGNANVLGYDLRKTKNREIPFLRRKMGFVFQDFKLLTDRNINQNLEFVLRSTGWKNKAEIEQRIKNVLEYVKMDKKGYRMPFEVSGGEQQRVAIARALLNDPELILADEPTGNLDPDISNDLMDLLFSIKESKGTSIVMATHDYALLDKYKTRIIRCHDGELEQTE